MIVLFHLYFHIFCYNHNKNLLNYYYSKRLKIIKSLGRSYNESNLLTLEDKINWIAIHDVNKLKGKCADKILLHEYSRKILKKDICNKILKIYDAPEQINFEELPDKFVLKTNHGSGYNIIVEDKSKLNFNITIKTSTNWLMIDYGKLKAEFHHSFIKRKTFAEEYIGKDVNNFNCVFPPHPTIIYPKPKTFELAIILIF